MIQVGQIEASDEEYNFAVHFVASGSPMQAVANMGYTLPGEQYSLSREFMKNPVVQQLIEHMSEKKSIDEFQPTKENLVKDAQTVYHKVMNGTLDPRAANAAISAKKFQAEVVGITGNKPQEEISINPQDLPLGQLIAIVKAIADNESKKEKPLDLPMYEGKIIDVTSDSDEDEDEED